MHVTAHHRGDGTYCVTGSLSGASIVVDTRRRLPSDRRASEGPRPMELILIGAATCPAVDLVEMLKKMRHPVEDLIVEVAGERAETHPRRFMRIALRFHIIGRNIPEKAAMRAVRLSVEKYCSVLASLNAELTWAVSVEPPRESGANPPKA